MSRRPLFLQALLWLAILIALEVGTLSAPSNDNQQASSTDQATALTGIHMAPGPSATSTDDEAVLEPLKDALKTRRETPSIAVEPGVEGAPVEDVPEPNRSLRRDVHCRTPQSLMLHSYYGVERMQALADAILAGNTRTLTYQGILEGLRRGQCPPGNSIVVSLDDLSTVRIDPTLKEMIAAFTDRGLVLVVAVIVSEPQDPEAWVYLRELRKLGVEIASHSLDHPNLPELSQTEIEWQVSGSHRAICENLGACPVSFVVPYGSMDRHQRIMGAAWEYSFVVGIAGGLQIEGDAPYYVGRTGPDIKSIERTLQVLEVAFGL